MSGQTAWSSHSVIESSSPSESTESLGSGSAPTTGDVVVDVHKVSKKFCRGLKRSLWYGASDMLAELSLGRRQSQSLRTDEFWAVHDVSFQLRQGEALGLVGRNGAGKTTLLRTIAGLIRPDTGEIRTRGRIAPLLALGAGFNPILTGRENIYINMAVLGLPTREIQRNFDAVVDFAEIEQALDAPVRTYSSGMTARLGFACAVHVQPDVFIIDEALAVGDVNFRGKCYRKLAELRRAGISLLLVSHSAHILMAVCDRAVYLQRGEMVMAGTTPDVVSRYTRDCEETNPTPAVAPQANGLFQKPPRSAAQSSGLDILRVKLLGNQSDALATLECGRPASVRVLCRCYRRIKDANLFVGVKRQPGTNEFVLALNSRHDGRAIDLEPGDHELVLRWPTCGLPRGAYSLKVYIEEPQLYMLDIVDWDKIQFQVHADSSMYSSAFYQPREWEIPVMSATSLRRAS